MNKFIRKLFYKNNCIHKYEFKYFKNYIWEKGGDSYDIGFVYKCKMCKKEKETAEIPECLKNKIKIQENGIFGFTKKISFLN